MTVGGLERFLLGKTTGRVVRGTEVPVLTVQHEGDATAAYPFADVAVGVDGSDCGRAARHLLSVVDVAALGRGIRAEALREALEADVRSAVEDAAGSPPVEPCPRLPRETPNTGAAERPV